MDTDYSHLVNSAYVPLRIRFSFKLQASRKPIPVSLSEKQKKKINAPLEKNDCKTDVIEG